MRFGVSFACIGALLALCAVGGGLLSGRMASAGNPPGAVMFVSSVSCAPGNGQTFSWTHAVTNGPSRFLLVAVAFDPGTNNAMVSAISYGGTPLLFVGAATHGSDARTELWKLSSPPVGSADVQVTMPAAVSGVTCGSTLWTNVDDAAPLGTPVTATGAVGDPSLVVASAGGNAVADAVAVSEFATVTNGAGQTLRWSGAVNNPGSTADMTGRGSSAAGAGSVTMSWDAPGGQEWAQIAVSIQYETVPVATPTPCVDMDCDGVPDSTDNCFGVWNPDQANSDRNFIDHSPPFSPSVDDRTRAFSDPLGNACDQDDDNDGLLDGEEATGDACGGTATDPLNPDTDGDRFLDGAECEVGGNPTNNAIVVELSFCGSAADTDGDKLADRLEHCFYGTDANNVDSDGDFGTDGARDGCEAASVNPDRVVNIADRAMIASAVASPSMRHVNVDINKDGAWNIGDVGLVALLFSGCGLPPRSAG